MPIWKRSHKNSGPKAKARRQGVLSRLEDQLKSGKSRDYTGDDLTLHDKKRIALEIVTLKSRV